MKTHKTLYFTRKPNDEEYLIITIKMFGNEYVVNEIKWNRTDNTKEPSTAKYWVVKGETPKKINAKAEKIVELSSIADVYSKCPTFYRRDYMEVVIRAIYTDNFLDVLENRVPMSFRQAA